MEVDPLVAFGGTALGALCAAVAALWRQSVAEGKRKDELIDRLLAKMDTLAGVQERGLDVAEREHKRNQRGRLQ